ncbi:exodeoxyribonuclease V subunit alpha [Francisellaceae bacterium CB300]
MYRSFKECQTKLAGVAAVDYYFAIECMELINQKTSLNDNQREVLFHVLVKLMNAYNLGHSCEHLSAIAGHTIFSSKEDGIEGYKLLQGGELESLFESINYDGLPIYYAKQFGSLYIRRLWLYENEVASFIKQRLQTSKLDIQKLQIVIDELFDSAKLPRQSATATPSYQRGIFQDEETDWQKIAVINSIIRKFSIISGGPGTGKTTTVAKLLLASVLLEQQSPRIALLAPTGKAAQRLTESLVDSLNNICHSILDTESSSSLKTLEAQTIHRFLGVRPNSAYIKYNQEHQAPYDIIVVDEASMLDINLFIKLIRAIGEDTKLVLIGDINQLPSVGVGSLLSSLTSESDNSFSESANAILKAFDERITAETSSLDYVVKLQKNYRSEKHIADFAIDVLTGGTDYQKHHQTDLQFKPLQSLDKNLKNFANKYKAVIQCQNYKEALNQLKKFRVLVANRNIDIGTNKLNTKIEKLLGRTPNSLYKGKPIMITQNNHSLELYNGDVGVLWNDESSNLKAYFEHREGKSFAINMLPKFEPVYAMTIHKTQGSEFDEVVIILPDEINQSLTKELLYTGITRAKRRLTIIADDSVLKTTIKKKVERSSNIKELIENLENSSDN